MERGFAGAFLEAKSAAEQDRREAAPPESKLIIRYGGKGRELDHYDAEHIIRDLLTELRWIDPANPTAAFVREALQRKVYRWPSLLTRYRLAKSRMADGSIAAQWNDAGKQPPPPGNILSVALAADLRAPSQSVRDHGRSSEEAVHAPHRCKEECQQSVATALSPRLSVRRVLCAIFRFRSSIPFLRGRFDTATIAEGGAVTSPVVNDRDRAAGGLN
jgi:hypothetical protein